MVTTITSFNGKYSDVPKEGLSGFSYISYDEMNGNKTKCSKKHFWDE